MSDGSGSGPGSLGSVRRKSVDYTQLVETSLVNGNSMPLVIRPAVDGVDLAEWTTTNRDQVDAYFDKHGAILFRGFGLEGAERSKASPRR